MDSDTDVPRNMSATDDVGGVVDDVKVDNVGETLSQLDGDVTSATRKDVKDISLDRLSRSSGRNDVKDGGTLLGPS